MDISGITETKKKCLEEMETQENHCVIYKGVIGNTKAKEGVGYIINKKY